MTKEPGFNLGLEILLFDRAPTAPASSQEQGFNLGLEILLFDRVGTPFASADARRVSISDSRFFSLIGKYALPTKHL